MRKATLVRIRKGTTTSRLIKKDRSGQPTSSGSRKAIATSVAYSGIRQAARVGMETTARRLAQRTSVGNFWEVAISEKSRQRGFGELQIALPPHLCRGRSASALRSLRPLGDAGQLPASIWYLMSSARGALFDPSLRGFH